MYYIGDLVAFADVASLLEGNASYMKDRDSNRGAFITSQLRP